MNITAGRMRATTALLALAAAVAFAVPPDASAQQAREVTARTIAGPATDPSVAIGPDGLPVVAFTTTRLVGDAVSVTGVKVVRCTDTACSGKEVLLRDAAGLGSPEIALDPLGQPMMAYVRQGEVEEVWLVRCETPGCELVVSNKIADGQGPLDLAVDVDGNAVVAFQHGDELRLGRCWSAACDRPTISLVDARGGDPSLALTGAGDPVISYKSRSPRRTRIAVCADAACAAIANVAEIPRLNAGRTTSIDVDGRDHPVMAADDADGGMKLVRCLDPLCGTFRTRGRAGLGADTASMTLDEFDVPVIVYVVSRVRVLKCNDPQCDSASFRDFPIEAEFDPLDSPALALGADGRLVIAYESTRRRVGLISCSDPFCGASGLDEELSYHVRNVATGEYLEPGPTGSVGMAGHPSARTLFEPLRRGTGVYHLFTARRTYLDADGAALGQSGRARRDDRWRIGRNGDGTHVISSVALDTTLVVNGAEPRLAAGPGSVAQARWRFVPAGQIAHEVPFVGRRVALQSIATGRWLDADANGAVNQSRNRRADDVWQISADELDQAYLRNDVFDRYLDADRDASHVRTSATLGRDDLWELVEAGDGVFTLRNVRFGGYLGTSAAVPAFGIERTGTVSPSTLWRIVPTD